MLRVGHVQSMDKGYQHLHFMRCFLQQHAVAYATQDYTPQKTTTARHRSTRALAASNHSTPITASGTHRLVRRCAF